MLEIQIDPPIDQADTPVSQGVRRKDFKNEGFVLRMMMKKTKRTLFY